MALQFNLNGSLVNVTDAKVSGHCPTNRSADQIDLMLVWDKDNVTLQFNRDPKDNRTWLANVTLWHHDGNGEWLLVLLMRLISLDMYQCHL